MILPAIIAAKPAGSSYVGPLDIVPGAVVAYSQRAMAAAWVSNAITIREDGGDTSMSFATTTNNAIDPAAVAAFLDGANGFVSAWLDQSGNGLNAASDLELQPNWKPNIDGALPAVQTGNEAQQLLTTAAGFSTSATGITIFIVARIIGAGGPGGGQNLFRIQAEIADYRLSADTYYNIPGDIYFNLYDPDNAINVSWITASAVADGLHLFVLIWRADGTATVLVDGVDLEASPDSTSGALTTRSDLQCLPSRGGTNQGVSNTFEHLEYAGVRSDPEIAAVSQNFAAYYGITLA